MNFPEPGTVPPVRRFPSLDRRASLPPAVPARDAGAATPHDHRGGARMQTVPTPAPRLPSQELGRDALPNSGAQLFSGSRRTLPQSPFSLLLGFSSLLSFSYHDFLSHCQLQLLANPALPYPAACPPCNALSPVVFGCESKGFGEKRRKGKKCRERERKYFVSRSLFTDRPSLSSASDL